MNREEQLKLLEGLHTVETVAEALQIARGSALNLLSKLKREGYATISGGGQRKRLYKISPLKQRSRFSGMFDILNKYSPMKLNSWYDHQVHGNYGPEETLIDALQTRSIRAILASLHLFNHIKDWRKLYHLAEEKDCWQKVGALYDIARLFMRVKHMPEKYRKVKAKKWLYLTERRRINFEPIAKKWKVFISFNKLDVEGFIR